MIKNNKKIPARWRICNCTDFSIDDGIIRTLLITHYPQLARLNKQPCTHWEAGIVKLLKKPAQGKPKD